MGGNRCRSEYVDRAASTVAGLLHEHSRRARLSSDRARANVRADRRFQFSPNFARASQRNLAGSDSRASRIYPE